MDVYNYSDLPVGFAMALAQNPAAMAKFGQLSPERQNEIINSTHGVDSKAEMQAIVRGLGG